MALFRGFKPKLLPTTPVHVQVSPALLVHKAVAVEPTCKQRILKMPEAMPRSLRSEEL